MKTLIPLLISKSRYVLDGNALGATATEAWRRRAFVDPSQPDAIIVSIGYPIKDSVYSDQRNIDFQASLPTQPSPEAGAKELLEFIGATLRPFVKSLFPNVTYSREALYGHSLGGRFALYALLSRPGLFDTYLIASANAPGNWTKELVSSWNKEANKDGTLKTKSAVRLIYGALEARPRKRRTETEEAFQTRAAFYASFDIEHRMKGIYQDLIGSPNLRHVELQEYAWSDHASLGAIGLTDGIDYFVDW